MEVDERGEETGRVIGVELPILEFDDWDDVPDLPTLWQLHGQEPMHLKDLLKRVQRELRLQTATAGP